MSDNPLNPELFALLNRQPHGAIITVEGVRYEFDTEFNAEKRRWELISRVTGEYYVLYCPLCGYTKHRTLYVNHAWRTILKDRFGAPLLTKDNRGNDRNPTDMLAVCYHCHAEQQYEPLNAMSSVWVNKLVKFFSGHKSKAMSTAVKAGTATAAVHVPMPAMIPLRDLPKDHRARQYVLNRPGCAVDPDYISDVYGIGYAHTFPYGDEEDPIIRAHQRANDRLIIPLVKDGLVVHWQGRVVDDNDPRSRWYFPPGSKPFPFRNWDMAKQFRGVIIVEGFFDEVAAGPCGLTIFTKDMNYAKAKMIADQWEYAIVGLDKKETQEEVTDDDGTKRMGGCHIVANRLISAGITNVPHIFKYPELCTGKDPSAMGPKAFWEALTAQLPKEYLDAVSVPRG